jgi:hypothetical protein
MVERIAAVLGVVAFVVLFWAMLRALPRFTAWGGLAARYPDPGYAGKKLWFRTGYLGPLRYAGTLVLGADPRGMWVSYHFLFLPGGAAFFVPWGDVSAFDASFGFARLIGMRFAGTPDVPIRISRSAARRLAVLSGGRFEVPGEERDTGVAP